MKSKELYSILREHLAPLCKANGFKRTNTMLSWVRPRGELYEGFWCQADQGGWDTYVGSKFVVEFQLGHQPLIGWETICRKRMGEMLAAAEREEIRRIQNDVIASLRRPPKNYPLLNLREEFSNFYLEQFKPIDQPFGERDDIWFRYASKQDADRWGEFLVAKLPGCFRLVETWKDPTLSD